MPRPPKIRRVESVPGISYFKPAGIPLRYLDEVVLNVEEAEALRLKDCEKLEQQTCAGKMHISRATFQRILASARQKVSDALLTGKAIRIEGGSFEMAERTLKCLNGHEWTASFEDITGEHPVKCPECESNIVSEDDVV